MPYCSSTPSSLRCCCQSQQQPCYTAWMRCSTTRPQPMTALPSLINIASFSALAQSSCGCTDALSMPIHILQAISSNQLAHQRHTQHTLTYQLPLWLQPQPGTSTGAGAKARPFPQHPGGRAGQCTGEGLVRCLLVAAATLVLLMMLMWKHCMCSCDQCCWCRCGYKTGEQQPQQGAQHCWLPLELHCQVASPSCSCHLLQPPCLHMQ